MNYQISHTTTYEYHETVATCQNIVHLAPRAVPRQTCHQHRLVVRPTPTSMSRRTDYFGNPVTFFSITEGHRRLSITSMSRVEVRRSTISLGCDRRRGKLCATACPRIVARMRSTIINTVSILRTLSAATSWRLTLRRSLGRAAHPGSSRWN